MNTKGSKHLDLQYRNFIEQGLNNNSSKSAIALVIGMDKSSICKEIKKHSFEVKFSRQGVSAIGTYDCQNIASCGFNAFCKSECPKRIPIPCKITKVFVTSVTKKAPVSLPNASILLNVLMLNIVILSLIPEKALTSLTLNSMILLPSLSSLSKTVSPSMPFFKIIRRSLIVKRPFIIGLKWGSSNLSVFPISIFALRLAER